MRKLIACGVALVAAVAFMVPGALGSAEQTPGVTARTIVVGGTFPLTGPAAAYAPIPLGMKAYFAYVNKRRGPDGKRGVMGRQIVWKYYDHGYNTATSLQLARKLVQEDKVFATVGDLGTEPVQASRSYMNSAKVPQVFVSTGASEFGTKYKEFPWTIGWQPDYVAEARLYGGDIRRNKTNAKIAILYQNDSYGRDYVRGFKAALGDANVRRQVVAEQAYDVLGGGTPQSQLIRLRQSGADTLMIFVTPTPTVQTYAILRGLNWKPDNIYVNSVSATDAFMGAAVRNAGAATVNGSISAQYLKDPASPVWANDATVKQYLSLMQKYNPQGRVTDGLNFYGFAKAHTFVRALYKAGKNPTRQSLMRALLSFNERSPFLLPGSQLKTGARDRFIISHQRLMTYNNGNWAGSGPLVDGRPRG